MATFNGARLTGTVSAALSGTIPAAGNAAANSQRDPAALVQVASAQTLRFGPSTGAFNVPCGGEFVLAAGASLTLNLYDGGATADDLTTVFGAAANLRAVRHVAVGVVNGGDSAGVTVGGAASNPWTGFWTGTFDVFPDGPAASFGSPGGKVVTSTAKNLKLTNNGAVSVTVAVAVAGVDVTPGTWSGFFGLITY